MPYQQEITANQANPQGLEALFQVARGRGEAGQFSAEMHACFEGEPGNLLYQAWHYRLLSAAETARPRARAGANWKLAIPLAILNGLIFWAISDPRLTFARGIPYLVLLAAPITALFVVGFLSVSSRKNLPRALAVVAALAILTAVAWLLGQLVAIKNSDAYLILMVPHLALLAWAGIGVALIGMAANPQNRFAFLIKSLEAAIVGGVYLIVGMAFGGITLGMFAALSITLPDVLMRFIAAGGAGLIPVIAVTTIYDPLAQPQDQDFTQGLSKFIGTMMRLLLPLTLGLLVVYVFVIPFNFLEPFKNRDVLIVYNVLLFGIMGLLVGATPINLEELSPRLASAMRLGILAVAALGALISLYALSAILYRTAMGIVTLNRLTMIGWNIINIALLGMIIAHLWRGDPQPWNHRIQSVYGLGAVAYVVWTLVVVLVMPFLFR